MLRKPPEDIFLRCYDYSNDDIVLSDKPSEEEYAAMYGQGSKNEQQKKSVPSGGDSSTNPTLSMDKELYGNLGTAPPPLPKIIQTMPSEKTQEYSRKPYQLKWQEKKTFDTPTAENRESSMYTRYHYTSVPKPFTVSAYSKPEAPTFSQPTFIRVTVPTTTLLHRYHLVHPYGGRSETVGLQAEIDASNARKYRTELFKEENMTKKAKVRKCAGKNPG